MPSSAASLVILLTVFAWPVTAQRNSLPAAIDRIVSRVVATDGPGVAYAVVRDGRLIHSGARGLANVPRRLPLTTSSVFDLASVSKQFTAMAILILSERGKLSLDDDARKYLPELPVQDRSRPIRIVDLLHMISGLADYDDLLDDTDGVTNEDVLKLVAKEPLQFPTGSRYVYSNTDYEMLGLIVKRVAGSSLGSFVNAAIFAPLGMRSSVVLEREGQAIPSRVTGYAKARRGDWKVDFNDTPTMVGDGNVFSSVDDVVKWDLSLRANTLVPAALRDRAFTSGVLPSGRRTEYGFGWMIDREGPRGLVSHTGGWNGTSTYIVRDLASGVTVVALSNIAGFDISDLGDEILNLVNR